MLNSSNAAEAATDIGLSGEKWNDAHLLGEDSPEWQSLLDRKAKLTKAGQAAQKQFKSAPEKLWRNWIEGVAPAAGKTGNGLSRHLVADRKDGTATIYGSLAGKERKAADVVTIDAIALDIDSGEEIAEALERIENLGIACIVYTSFNHGSTASDVKRDLVLRKLDLESDHKITDDDLRQYLRQDGRKTEGHIASLEVTDPKAHVAGGIKVLYSHDPLPKWRAVFPLAERVEIMDLAGSHRDALGVFARKVLGLAKMLDLIPDTSCTDPSRLFYDPRHRDGAQPFSAIVRGRGITLDEIEAAGAPARGAAEKSRPVTPSGIDLMTWAGEGFARRLQIVDLIRDVCPDKERNDPAAGKIELECPFEAWHTEEGGTACWAEDAIERHGKGYDWGCHHDSCKGYHDRLDMLEKALDDGWFDEDFIHEGSAYLLHADDDEDPADAGKQPKANPASAGTEGAVSLNIADPLGETMAEAKATLKPGGRR